MLLVPLAGCEGDPIRASSLMEALQSTGVEPLVRKAAPDAEDINATGSSGGGGSGGAFGARTRHEMHQVVTFKSEESLDAISDRLEAAVDEVVDDRSQFRLSA